MNISYQSKCIGVEDSNAVTMAARNILEGKVILVPTDTVYGLSVDAGNADAWKKISIIKKK